MKQPRPTFYLLLRYAFFVCIFFSCQDDESPEQQPNQATPIEEGDVLRVDESRLVDLFPLDSYRNNSAIVFRDFLGQELKFLIAISQDSVNVNGMMVEEVVSFTNHFIDITLVAEDSINYELNFRVGPSADLFESTFDHCIGLNILKYNREQMEPNTPEFNLSLFLGNFICERTYEPNGFNIDLLGTIYEDVLMTTFMQNDGITKVYYTTELGLAAFEDEVNNIYVFDRFEN